LWIDRSGEPDLIKQGKLVAATVAEPKLAPLSASASVDAVVGAVEELSVHSGWSVPASRLPVTLDVPQTRVPLANAAAYAIVFGEAAPVRPHHALHDHEQQQRSQHPGSPFHPHRRHAV